MSLWHSSSIFNSPSGLPYFQRRKIHHAIHVWIEEHYAREYRSLGFEIDEHTCALLGFAWWVAEAKCEAPAYSAPADPQLWGDRPMHDHFEDIASDNSAGPSFLTRRQTLPALAASLGVGLLGPSAGTAQSATQFVDSKDSVRVIQSHCLHMDGIYIHNQVNGNDEVAIAGRDL
jgi:hypothetical protein